MAWATAGFIFAIVLFSDATLSWVNNYDQSLHFECPAGEHLNRLESQHSNRHEDRVWNFGCKNGFVSEKCHWSDHETSYDKPMNFTCQDGGLVAGLSSRHSNDQEDRVWRFKCCSLNTKPGFNCWTTDYINYWDSYMDYTIEDGSAIRGVESYHSNNREDRRWKLRLCKYSFCTAVHMEVISKIDAPHESGNKVVGIVTSQGCSPGIFYTIGLDQQTGVEETYSISDTKEHSFNVETAITVGFSTGVSLGVKTDLNFEVTKTFSYGHTLSKTVTKEMSKSFSAGSSQELEYPGPGAALIIADCKQYEIGQTNVEVEYTVNCDDGNTYKEKSEVYISANIYGQTHYMQKHASFPEGSCSATTEACIDGIRGKYAVNPEEVIHDFENCVAAVNGTVN